MKIVIGNQQLARITNQKLIIDTIRETGPVSRAGISKSLHLSAPTVSCNIDKLLEKGILNEVGVGDSSGGRKPIMLEFNYNYGNIIGVDLSGEVVKIALGNLKPEIIQEISYKIPGYKNNGLKLDWLINKVDDILLRNPSAAKRIMAISIAFPGIVDGETGDIKSSSRFGGWSDLNVKNIFEEHFNVPLLINNDINTAVSGELLYGCGSGYRNLVYIGIDVGIGAGIVINGSLYEGSHYNAGEISRIVLGPGVLDDHDDVTCLESVLSITMIVADIKKSIQEGISSIITGLAGGDADKINFSHVVKALSLGDRLCSEHIKRYAKILGTIIANITNTLDVELIIIGNEIVKLGDPFIETVRCVVKNLAITNPVIVYSKLNTESVIYGTFAVCLKYVFHNIIE